MFCKDCGSEIKEDSIFCKNCGAGVQETEATIPEKIDHKHSGVEPSLRENGSITQREWDADDISIHDERGNFRWMYEFSLWKNPTILIITWKIMMIACCIPALLMFFLTLFDGDGAAEALRVAVSVFGIVAGILTVLLAAAYVMIALLYGGKYYVLFKMYKKGVHHIQLKGQYSKAQALGFLTLLAGTCRRESFSCRSRFNERFQTKPIQHIF